MNQDIEFNDLEFLQILGLGAFGIVSLVKHMPTQQFYAIKQFNKKKLSEQQIQRIYSEGQMLASLNHQNIVRFYKLYSTENDLYILMEYIKYGTLHDYFKNKKNSYLTDEEIKQLMQALLSCVCYIHQKNIIHRDIKPDNILIADETNLSKIKLADFGLSSQFESHQQATFTRQCGTLNYMSPEYFDTYNRCTKAVDVYSCGVLLYELTHAGRHPFLTKMVQTLSQIQKLITAGVYNQFSCLPEFEIIIRKMTAKEQSERLSIEEALGAFKNNRIPTTLSDMMQGMDKQYKIIRMLKIVILIR